MGNVMRTCAAFVVVSTVLLPATSGMGEELWTVAEAHGKGDDYLHVVDVKAERPLPSRRRLRCEKSLPRYVEEMAEAAERIEGKLLLRIQAKIVSETSGERATEVKILAVVLTPDSNWPLLADLKNWKEHSMPLPEEKMGSDPFAVPGRAQK